MQNKTVNYDGKMNSFSNKKRELEDIRLYVKVTKVKYSKEILN